MEDEYDNEVKMKQIKVFSYYCAVYVSLFDSVRCHLPYSVIARTRACVRVCV